MANSQPPAIGNSELHSSLWAERPRVSVIIPCFNQAQYVGAAIQSVLAQSFQNYEAIVVDDGSEDNTRSVVAEFGDRVRYIRQENGGLSAARNTGILAAKGEFIALLDSDDLYEPHFLETLVSILDQHSEYDAVYCVARTIDGNGNLLPQRIGRVVPSEHLYDVLLRGGFFPPICMFARKYCYENTGHMFDESLCRAEDLDLWLKFASRFTIVGTDVALVRYRVMSAGLSSNPELVLQYRLNILANHLHAETFSESHWTNLHREVFARSHLAAALDYLQMQSCEQAYQHVWKAFDIYPALVQQLDTFYELALGDQPKGFRGDFLTLDVIPNACRLIEMLNRILREPGVSDTLLEFRQMAYSNAYLAIGMLFYGKRDFNRSRRYLKRAMIANPRKALNRRLQALFFKSYLPAGMVDRLGSC